MKIPSDIRAYGDPEYRGACPNEAAEHATFFNWLRETYPEGYGRIALHPKNEGKRYRYQAQRDFVMGLSKGAPDIIIAGAPTFCCELKRRDHTKSRLSWDQIEWLRAAGELGAFVCVALGWEAAREAFLEWRDEDEP